MKVKKTTVQKIKKEIFTVSDGEMVVIFEDTWVDGDLKSTEVIGFYYGEENEEDTRTFAHHGTKAIYE